MLFSVLVSKCPIITLKHLAAERNKIKFGNCGVLACICDSVWAIQCMVISWHQVEHICNLQSTAGVKQRSTRYLGLFFLRQGPTRLTCGALQSLRVVALSYIIQGPTVHWHQSERSAVLLGIGMDSETAPSPTPIGAGVSTSVHRANVLSIPCQPSIVAFKLISGSFGALSFFF